MADALCAALKRRGYEVLKATTAAAALAVPPVDVVLLDLGLPDRDGIDVCRAMRSRSDTAIIAVTARGEVTDRVQGLRNGFDDYVVKPFSMVELEARIEAVLRRAKPRLSGAMNVGPLRIDPDTGEAWRDGSPLALARKEFALLLALARCPGAVVGRERLLIDVWQSTWSGGRTLDVHMSSLRSKLGAPPLIETVRGIGFRLAVPSPAADTSAGRP